MAVAAEEAVAEKTSADAAAARRRSGTMATDTDEGRCKLFLSILLFCNL